jgi:hypothetical protein
MNGNFIPQGWLSSYVAPSEMFCTEHNVKDAARLHVDVSNIRDEEEINTLSGRDRLSFILIYMLPNVNFISPLSSILSAKKN